MTTLHIGNSRTEGMVGDLTEQTVEQRRFAGVSAQHVVWFAKDTDVIVLPRQPQDEYLRYVTGITGTDCRTLEILVPPAGELGDDLLTPDRLADERFREQVRIALTDRTVQNVSPIYPDISVADFAFAIGELDSLPGHRFISQDGGAIVNSKACFRAIAAGTATAIPAGVVVSRSQDAVTATEDILTTAGAAIIKQEYQAGGLGNVILSRLSNIQPIGAREVVRTPNRRVVEEYIESNWESLTGKRRNRVVIEQYYPDATAVSVEYLVTDNGIELLGHSEAMMEPLLEGILTPTLVLSPAEISELIAMGQRLCEPYHLMGYRGILTPDAFLTKQRQLFFSEMNGRISAATHLFLGIGRCLGESLRLGDRVLIEHSAWQVPSFAAAVSRLQTEGLSFDPGTHTGVVLVLDQTSVNSCVRYCTIAQDRASALAYDRHLANLFKST